MKTYFVIALIAAIVVWSAALPLTHPDKTYTRLLLDHGAQYLGMFGLYALAVAVARLGRKPGIESSDEIA